MFRLGRIGLIFGGVWGFGGAIRDAQAHGEYWNGDDGQYGDGSDGGEDRTRIGHRFELFGGFGAFDPVGQREAFAFGQGTSAQQGQHGGCQGDGHQHGNHDDEATHGSHEPQEGDAGEVERQQGDDHGGAGEYDGVTRGAVGDPDGVSQRHSGFELGAVSVDDK